MLPPFNSPEHIKKHETTFADIHAFVLSVEPPKYPFPIDATLAQQGRGLYQETCARCHGSSEEYPNKIVPLKTLGTYKVAIRVYPGLTPEVTVAVEPKG